MELTSSLLLAPAAIFGFALVCDMASRFRLQAVLVAASSVVFISVVAWAVLRYAPGV